MGREVNGLIESVSKVDSCITPISLNTPVTPDSNRETMIVNNGDSPRTPKDTLFDPFAPGSEILCNAPLQKIYCENSHGKIFRKLVYGLGKKYKFDDLDEDEADEAESEDERALVRNLYGDLLEVIAYVQAQEVLAAFPEETLMEDGSGSCSCSCSSSSPSSNPCLPIFNGIAETCPPAPRRKMDHDAMKPSVIFDSSICKKLEF